MKPLLLISLLFLAVTSYSQKSESTNAYGIQLLVSESYGSFSSLGRTIALNGEIIKNRVTITPNVEYGNYSTSYKTDAQEIDYDQWSIGANIFYSLLQIKYFQLKVGTGVSAIYQNGYKNEWLGMYQDFNLKEEDINRFSATGNIIAGIRFGNKFSVEILPLNLGINLDEINFAIKLGVGYLF